MPTTRGRADNVDAHCQAEPTLTIASYFQKVPVPTRIPPADTSTTAVAAAERTYPVHAESPDGLALDAVLTVGNPVPDASDLPVNESTDPYCVGASSRALVVRVKVRMTMPRGMADDMTILFSNFANNRDFVAAYSSGPKCKSPGNSEMEPSITWHATPEAAGRSSSGSCIPTF